MKTIHLSDRAVIRISGEETKPFLQNLVSNDVNAVRARNSVLSALLSPQGKFLFDFFMVADGADILLDTEAEHADALVKRLNLYKLRSKVTISKEESLHVYSAFEGTAASDSNAYPDPRDDRMGVRFIIDSRDKGSKEPHARKEAHPLVAEGVRRITEDRSPEQAQDIKTYESHRIALGIPEGSKDATERTILLENGYDKLNGVSFTKGCYIGQEVTARSYHKGELRKYIFKVESESDLPTKGTPIMAGESSIGEMRSTAGKLGLALIRTDRLSKATQQPTADNIPLTISTPFWHNIEQPK